jgi:hypothetical protein
MNCGVYAITLLCTGAQYVGSAKRFGKRFGRHKSDLRNSKHHSIYLQRAWNKYGEGAFEFKPLLLCSKENLLVYEQLAIDALRPVFNMCPVAGSVKYRPISSETIKKISASSRGRRLTPETRARISAASLGKPKSPQHVAIIREIGRRRIGAHLSDETKRKMSETLRGRKRPPLSAEIRAKISATLTGMKQSEETKKKRSDSLKGRKGRGGIKLSEQHKARIAAGHARRRELGLPSSGEISGEKLRGRKFSEEMKQKMRGRIVSLETRARLSMAITRNYQKRRANDRQFALALQL